MVRGLWKLPDGKDWLRRKLGLVLMDWATLSKSLIQFSVNGWNCVSSLLLTCGQTVVEVMKMMVKDKGTSFKRSHACTATLSAPTLQQATADLLLCQGLLDNHWQVWSVSCGVTAPFSWVLVHTRFCPSPSRVYFSSPVSAFTLNPPFPKGFWNPWNLPRSRDMNLVSLGLPVNLEPEHLMVI